MLGRQKSSKKGAPIPGDWQEGITRLLNQSYEKQCKEEGRYFDVYGQIYPQELLIIVSYLSEKDESLTPVTLFITCGPDQMASVAKVKETQNDYVELAGLFFDEIFGNPGWDEFEPAWQDVVHNHRNYHYKISRENINLTLKADQLLGDEFDDVEFESDTEN